MSVGCHVPSPVFALLPLAAETIRPLRASRMLHSSILMELIILFLLSSPRKLLSSTYLHVYPRHASACTQHDKQYTSHHFLLPLPLPPLPFRLSLASVHPASICGGVAMPGMRDVRLVIVSLSLISCW